MNNPFIPLINFKACELYRLSSELQELISETEIGNGRGNIRESLCSSVAEIISSSVLSSVSASVPAGIPSSVPSWRRWLSISVLYFTMLDVVSSKYEIYNLYSTCNKKRSCNMKRIALLAVRSYTPWYSSLRAKLYS